MDILFAAVLSFDLIVFLWDSYLSSRQYRLYKDTPKVPDEVSTFMSQETFSKSRLYQMDKSNFGFWHHIYSQVEGIVSLFYGLPMLWYASSVLLESFGFSPDREIVQSCIFLVLTQLVSMVLEEPWSVYGTFVIEERHGFNKYTVGFYIKDKIKKFLVFTPLTLVITSLLIYVIQWGGEYFFVYAWLFCGTVMLVMVFIYADFIAPLFDKYTPLPAGELRTAIENLAATVEFPLTKLYLVDGSKRSAHSNAYFYGFHKNKRIVLFDTLLRPEMLPEEMRKKSSGTEDESAKETAEEEHEQVDKGEGEDTPAETVASKDSKTEEEHGCTLDQILAVLLHELGHWKLSHNLKNIIISQINLFLCFFIFGLLVHQQYLYSSFGFPDSRPTLIGMVIIFQYIFSPYNEVMGFIMTQICRRFEFQADEFAAKRNRSKELGEALVQLNKDNLSFPVSDWLYSECNHSHPSLIQRLHALKKYQ
eukprot:scpid53651/ scgid18757/ CAAX prenyl protease 1 homolog; Farnesylated proteins-converting enzyme 1; Prenyl protein-specific endoprotease 1; Zinc metalloproteinase Ste24 homolog